MSELERVYKQVNGEWTWVTEEANGGSQPDVLEVTVVPVAPLPPQFPVVAWVQEAGVVVSRLGAASLPLPAGTLEATFENLEMLVSPTMDGVGSGYPAFPIAPFLLVEVLSFPALISAAGDFSPSYLDALTSLDVSALASVGGNFYPNSLDALTSLDVSALQSVGGSFSPNSLGVLTSLDVSALQSGCGDFYPNSLSVLTSLDVSALQSVGGSFSPNSLDALTSLDVSGLLAVLSNYFTVTGAALTQATVNAILVKLASLDGTAGTTSFDNGTVDLSGGTSASPSAPGLAAKATLEGRGNTVTVN